MPSCTARSPPVAYIQRSMLSFQASAVSRRVGACSVCPVSSAIWGVASSAVSEGGSLLRFPSEFGNIGGGQQRGNFGCEREGRIARVFFPAILLRHGTV